MPNTYFQFKEFTIHQDQCAMKVSTEACILGAWVPGSRPSRILDIGAGTGLLSLMLAQRMASPIDAVELDSSAAQQAQQNVADSNWSDRVKIANENIFDYVEATDRIYDLIISNPPFFSNSLKSETGNKNLAKHDTSNFDKANLAVALQALLSKEGRAFILYPEFEAEQFKKEVEKIGLFCESALIIRNQPNAAIFRMVSVVSKAPLLNQPEELNIREGQSHSEQFVSLMKPYYLKY